MDGGRSFRETDNFFELGGDCGPNLLAVAETFCTQSAYLYRYDSAGSRLTLYSRTSDSHEIPTQLNLEEAEFVKLLLNQYPYCSETRKLPSSLSGFPSPYLILCSLRYDKRVHGLLIVGTQGIPSKRDLHLLATRAFHFSLLLSIEDSKQEVKFWRERSKNLEEQVNTMLRRLASFGGSLG